MCFDEDLLYKEKLIFPKKKRSVLHYYKNPKAFPNQGMHNLPNSGTLWL